ncbi:MAG: Crp/Fnr family transcriptional regulator [Leadbetterella sp.]
MKSYIEKVTGRIDEETLELLIGIMKDVELPKDQFLLEQGQTCKDLWFLKSGAIKIFEIVNGEIRNSHFVIAECFVTNYISIVTKQPSELFFQATENCQLGKINYENLEKLYEQNHKIEHIGRIMAEMQFVAEYNLRKLLLNMDALERYEYVEKHQPEIFNHFALKDIASYLGITPVSLSRLRKYRFEKR